MRPSALIETVSRSSGGFSVCVATGRLTSMLRLIIGAVTMKMISSTSTTSISGVTLISPIDGVSRRERSVRYEPRPRRPIAFVARAARLHYVKLRSTRFRNSSAKSSTIDASTFTRLL